MADNAQQVTLNRIFNAPVQKVWDAWTTPEGWVSWFGKPGEVPPDSASMDVRVGGRWKSTTIADGNTIPFSGSYKEVAAPNRLVFTFENPDDPGDKNVETVTVDLKNVDDQKTEMTFSQAGHLPPEEYEKGLRVGWTGFFDALEQYLQRTTP